MKLKVPKKETLIMILLIIIQTIIYIISGANKSYIHMDEAYSMGLASYDKVEIQANDDFYDKWHDGKYYEDYLTVNEDEKWEYSQVYENQKNDVHPPLYYLFLRIAMGFNIDNYSNWPGIIVNIIIYVFITIFMYLILKKLLNGKNRCNEKSMILAFVSSITLAAITSAIYIRMYALSALNIVITTYLHLKLLDCNTKNYKLLFYIGLSALIGSLTHYYYLFYLVMLFIMFVVKYIREKQYKELVRYIITMCIAGALSLIIFPYSIQHMFFGYRGQGAISNLTNVSQFLSSIAQYIWKIHDYVFNCTLGIILIAIIGIIIYKKIKKKKLIENKNKYIKYITIPTLFYFILVAISSPWIELRYIMPVCGIIFIIVLFYIEELLSNVLKEEDLYKTIIAICVVIILMPILLGRLNEIPGMSFKAEPEVMYSDKKEIVEKMKNELNVPTLYMFNSSNNRFLDDILLFSILDESYVAKDLDYNEENINKIMKGKDLSNGMIVFINGGQENDDIIDVIKNATKLEESTYLKRLNACDVYYIK